ncbi:MAG: hypothetical protein VW080_11810 [Flavobacteriaceae bacterium]
MIIVIGISVSFWINNKQIAYDNQIKEKQLLQNIASSLQEIKVHIENRKNIFDQENELMDYMSQNWGRINTDSIVDVLQEGKYVKSFHNLFLDYREFHPPIAEIESFVADGSIELIKNPEIKVALIDLTDSRLDYIAQNVASEIDLQQAFRAVLIQNKDPILLRALQTSQTEMYDRFVNSDPSYRNKITLEINAILKQPEARNYLNLKIRQRYFVMLFFNQFKDAVQKIEQWILKELSESF